MSSDLKNGQMIMTVQGCNITVKIDGSVVKVDSATIGTTDIEAQNGVVHVINAVLMPTEGCKAADSSSSRALLLPGLAAFACLLASVLMA